MLPRGIHIWRAAGAPGVERFRQTPVLRGLGLAGMALLLLYGAAEQGDPFIYFQF